ncbi:phosphate ABC transporter substrate-binding protein [Azospirillum soli]|uniref:phosphate ABC transporter substrate-binding protein n=1 Tax=Azospirillum soli TaxID=1304799 RepID=UPI001AEA7F2B|nr:phosphate ABC transporter substrate-binding protein [Azospirillum soli]MBP2316492.1 phosphate transport system substrate-binding protein [Azospirillum soli]
MIRAISFPFRKGRSFLALSVMALLSVAASAHAAETIVLTGSSTVAPLMAEIGKRFEETHPNLRIDVQTGGSSRGVRDARAGLADIGMVSRPLTDSERDLTAFTLAYDGVAFILHKSNPVKTLTRQQIIDIFTGKVRDWSEIGPGRGTIVVENKAEGRSTLELFLTHFDIKSSDVKAAVVVGDNQEAIKVIAGNPLAIGYVSIGSAVTEAGLGVPIKPLPMDGVEATIDAVKQKRFPLVRELNLVVRKQPEGVVKEFIAYAQSDQVTDLVKDLYYVPVGH